MSDPEFPIVEYETPSTATAFDSSRRKLSGFSAGFLIGIGPQLILLALVLSSSVGGSATTIWGFWDLYLVPLWLAVAVGAILPVRTRPFGHGLLAGTGAGTAVFGILCGLIAV